MQFLVPIFKLCNAVNGGGTGTVYATVLESSYMHMPLWQCCKQH